MQGELLFWFSGISIAVLYDLNFTISPKRGLVVPETAPVLWRDQTEYFGRNIAELVEIGSRVVFVCMSCYRV
jgi:hypothetical protein